MAIGTCRSGRHKMEGSNVYVVPSTGARCCHPCRLEKKREYNSRHRDKVRLGNDRNRWKTYGVSEAEVAEARLRQKGLCLICNRKRPLVVDHDHASLKFRGLLCKPCNTALGLIDDNPELGLKLVEYLKETQWQ